MHKNTESELDAYCEFLDNWDKLTEQEKKRCYSSSYSYVTAYPQPPQCGQRPWNEEENLAPHLGQS